MQLKYIVDSNNNFVIFQGQTHAKMVKGMDGAPVGAGFCDIESMVDTGSIKVSCYGRSVSLNVNSRPEDAEIINRQMTEY